MNESPITQDVSDGSANGGGEKNGLYAQAAKHPILAGGVVLLGAGLAYAAARALNNREGEVARDVHVETSIAIDRSPEELCLLA